MSSGKLGEITVVRGVFNFSMNPAGRDNQNPNVRLVSDWGGGCLWDVGVYPLSFAQYIFGGPPKWVFGSQWISEFEVDETFCGQMGYSDGGLAQISSSFRAPFHTHVEIIGTEGRLESTRPFTGVEEDAQRLTLYDDAGKAEEIAIPQEYLYLGEIEDMHSAILDGMPNYLSLQETRNHVKTVLALYESAKTGKVYKL